MKTKILFIFTILLQLAPSFEAHSAASAPEEVLTSVPEEVLKRTPLPGGLVQLTITPPAKYNYFTFSYGDSGISLEAGYVEKEGKSLPIAYIDRALSHGKGVMQFDGIIRASTKIEDNAGTYVSKESIELRSRRIEMAQTGFVWNPSHHCMLSGLKGCPSPVRGIELVGKEKDDEGNFRALVYGILNFDASDLKGTFSTALHPATPEAFKKGLTVLGCRTMKIIIEGNDE